MDLLKNNEMEVKNEKDIKEHEIEPIRFMTRRYYQTWSSADSKRRKGDRIYYKAGKGYYIIRPKKPQQWWDIF